METVALLCPPRSMAIRWVPKVLISFIRNPSAWAKDPRKRTRANPNEGRGDFHSRRIYPILEREEGERLF
jgi:hypothetical protein